MRKVRAAIGDRRKTEDGGIRLPSSIFRPDVHLSTLFHVPTRVLDFDDKEAFMLILVEPALAYKDPCLDAVREFHAAGEYDVDAEQLAARFEDLICRLGAAKDPTTAPPGELPFEDFWLMDGDEWIGKLTLRTTINAQHLHAGGHIGYEIRPSKRRCGYGTALLRLGLEKARERGLHRVLLTCAETNIGSRKIIETNGGQLENAIVVAGKAVHWLRYWINLDQMIMR